MCSYLQKQNHPSFFPQGIKLIRYPYVKVLGFEVGVSFWASPMVICIGGSTIGSFSLPFLLTS